MQWIAADQIFDGEALLRDAAIGIRDGRIVRIAPAQPDHPKKQGVICPGYVDLQVNGGGGVLLNNDPTPEGIAAIIAAHQRLGSAHIMPTVITDAPEVLDRATQAAVAMQGTPGLIGLHIEGPHISLRKRGTHAAAHIRPMDQRTMDAVAHLQSAGVRVMITVAPEATTHAQIARLTDMGAIVSLGHTDAPAEVLNAALAAGAICGTHLFNAMSPMQARAPGAVGALINADCFVGLICDGHHVDVAMIDLAIRARPVPDRCFLVSDAMATVGGPDQFTLYAQTISLKDGRLINAEGALAGAHLTMADAVKRLVAWTRTPLVTALKMATTIPATCIGAPELGQLVGQRIRDVLLLDADLTPHCLLASVTED